MSFIGFDISSNIDCYAINLLTIEALFGNDHVFQRLEISGMRLFVGSNTNTGSFSALTI